MRAGSVLGTAAACRQNQRLQGRRKLKAGIDSATKYTVPLPQYADYRFRGTERLQNGSRHVLDGLESGR
jgi:hypothetical protein